MPVNLSELNALEQLAQACTHAIAQCLEPGMSEDTAASLMHQWLHEHGCEQSGHRCLAWFGERTHQASLVSPSARARLRPAHFPTHTRLEAGAAFTLYCAPKTPQLMAESLYCDSAGLNPAYQQLRFKVGHLKHLLIRAINAGQTLEELTQLMQQLAQAQGTQLCLQGATGGWIRPYSHSPNTGNPHHGLLEKVVDLTGNQAPAHLPAADTSLAVDSRLTTGLWVIQPWLDDGYQAAGLRELLYIGHDGRASWLGAHPQKQAA